MVVGVEINILGVMLAKNINNIDFADAGIQSRIVEGNRLSLIADTHVVQNSFIQHNTCTCRHKHYIKIHAVFKSAVNIVHGFTKFQVRLLKKSIKFIACIVGNVNISAHFADSFNCTVGQNFFDFTLLRFFGSRRRIFIACLNNLFVALAIQTLQLLTG